MLFVQLERFLDPRPVDANLHPLPTGVLLLVHVLCFADGLQRRCAAVLHCNQHGRSFCGGIVGNNNHAGLWVDQDANKTRRAFVGDEKN